MENFKKHILLNKIFKLFYVLSIMQYTYKYLNAVDYTLNLKKNISSIVFISSYSINNNQH